MAIAFDSSISGRNSTGDITTGNLTVANVANRILIACTTVQDSNHTNFPVVSIKWNTTESFTKVRSDEPAGNVRTEIWYLLNPTVTTSTVVVDITGLVGECSVGVISLNGVNQVAPEANNGTTGSGTTPSISLTTVADNAWSITVSSAEAAFSAINNSQTKLHVSYPLTDQSFENAYAGYRGPISPAGATTLSYTCSSAVWAISAVSVAPASGTTTSTTSTSTTSTSTSSTSTTSTSSTSTTSISTTSTTSTSTTSTSTTSTSSTSTTTVPLTTTSTTSSSTSTTSTSSSSSSTSTTSSSTSTSTTMTVAYQGSFVLADNSKPEAVINNEASGLNISNETDMGLDISSEMTSLETSSDNTPHMEISNE